MIPFFERELVDKRKWITHDEFVESLAIGQMTPVPPSSIPAFASATSSANSKGR
jgi:chromate transport protein ChrA